MLTLLFIFAPLFFLLSFTTFPPSFSLALSLCLSLSRALTLSFISLSPLFLSHTRRRTRSEASDVSLHVQGQVIGPGETPVAVVAFEGLGAGVFAVVPGQLVAPGETPLAAFP